MGGLGNARPRAGLHLTLTHMWTFCSLGFPWGLFYEDGGDSLPRKWIQTTLFRGTPRHLAGQSRSEQTSAPSLLPCTPLLPLGSFPSPLLSAHFLLSFPSFPFSFHPSILPQSWLRCSDHIFSALDVWFCRGRCFGVGGEVLGRSQWVGQGPVI